MSAGLIAQRFATAWALFQGLLIEALPFLLLGVLIATAARWFAPGGRWVRRLPAHPLLGPLTGAGLGLVRGPGAGLASSEAPVWAWPCPRPRCGPGRV
jgi:uncharacterized membrane protein YraQ (UPF0718 family)